MKKLILLIRNIAFCVLLLAALFQVSRILERKESSATYRPFMESQEGFDVLFMGNSHMVNSVFPMELWRDYGIASYNIAGYGNTIPTSYWAMRNAFDYSQPKLMVIDISGVSREEKLSSSSGDLHNTLDCYPLSLTKIQAIRDLIDDPSAVDDDGNRFVDMIWEYYLPLGKYHSRWNDLSRDDFYPQYSVEKGAKTIVNVSVPRDYQIFEHGYATEETGWGFVYLRRMIEECQARGIDVLLTHLPFPSKEYQQCDANAVRYIAEEYGVRFVDFVYSDYVVDYDTDLFDPSSHLNASGGKKVTDFLGKYITDHYSIPDRRTDSAYSHWHNDRKAYLDRKLSLIRMHRDPANALMLMHDNDFIVHLYVPQDSRVYDDDTLLLLMHNIAREHVFEEDELIKYSSSMYPLEMLDEVVQTYEAYYLISDRSVNRFEERIGDAAADSFSTHFSLDQANSDMFIQLYDVQTGQLLLTQSYSI